jgi:hypothetical protein
MKRRNPPKFEEDESDRSMSGNSSVVLILDSAGAAAGERQR